MIKKESVANGSFEELSSLHYDLFNVEAAPGESPSDAAAPGVHIDSRRQISSERAGGQPPRKFG